jgi:hypothetical protein
MSLYRYLVRLETVLHSRQDIDVELLQVDVITIGVKFISELRFYDGSHLSIVEQLEPVGQQDYNRVAYKYHYQDADGNLFLLAAMIPSPPILNRRPPPHGGTD